MAKNIALTLTLNGVEQTITSVQELEKSIKDARTALGSTFSGTQDELKTFNKQINDAQQSLDTLRNKKGQEETFKSIGNLAKIGSAVTSSFAAATAAVSLFGGNTEQVSKAAETAQLALTLALSGREIAEGAVAVATGVANLQTELQVLSTNAANAATKRFYATLAANPYTAIAIAIGVVIAAIYALTTAEDKELKLQKELVGVRRNAAKELKAQLTILTDNVSTLNLEEKAIDDLKKQYPGFNAFIDDNNKLTKEGITFLRAKIGLMEQEAIIAAGQEKNAKAQIEYEEKLLEINKRKPGLFSGAGGLSFESLQNAARLVAQKELEKATAGANAAIAKATIAADKYAGVVKGGNKILENQVELEDKNKKAKDAAADAVEKQTQEYLKLLDAQNQAIKNYGKINEGEAKVSAGIVDRAKEFVSASQKLLKTRQDFFNKTKSELGKQTDELLFEIIPSSQQLTEIEDVYSQLFSFVGGQLSAGGTQVLDETGNAVKFNLEFIKKQYITYYEGIADEAEKAGDKMMAVQTRAFFLDPDVINKEFGKLGDESEAALVEYYQRLAQTAELYSKGVKFGTLIIRPETRDDIENSLLDITDRAVAVLNDPSILKGFKDSAITEEILKIFTFPTKTIKDFKNTLDPQGSLDKYNEAVRLSVENLVGFAKVQASQKIEGDKVRVSLEEQKKALQDLDKQLGITRNKFGPGQDDLTRLSTDDITKYIQFVKEALSQEPKLLGDYLTAIYEKKSELLQRLGEKGVMDLFAGISSGFTDLKGKSEEELVKLISFLETSAADIEVKFGKPAAQSFIDLADNAKKALSSIGDQKFLTQLQKGITEFISTLSDLGSTISDFYSLQLTKLENQNTKIQSQILGDSVKSNEKRIEQEKIYQEEKGKLEKKAALRSLQISRTTALANAAESITKIFAKNEPISAAIFAAIVAANNLVQVGIITAQINELDAFQRGGMIKGQGGLLVGPAHEQGGIRFGAMGLELEGGESVINRQSTMNYGALLSQINQSGGGKPLVSNNFDDSRILEALAKQRTEPIRAYVVESEITNKQGITKRLEQLSQF
jgi:hypothetical protein